MEERVFSFAACGMKALTVGPLEVNCYIIYDRNSREAVIVDPGGDEEAILASVRKDSLEVKYIINTHGHFDHVGADGYLKKELKAKIAIHWEDVGLLETVAVQSVAFGIHTAYQGRPDVPLKGGEKLAFGAIVIEALHTPGHTRGGVSLYIRSEALLFTGDTLFAGSVGRTDLPGGSFDVLMESIRKKILPLGDNVKVFPGHGPSTTIKDEKTMNPFITENP